MSKKTTEERKQEALDWLKSELQNLPAEFSSFEVQQFAGILRQYVDKLIEIAYTKFELKAVNAEIGEKTVELLNLIGRQKR